MKTRGNVRKIDIPIGYGIHNKFEVEIVDSVTGNLKSKAIGFNCICNALWTNLLAGSTYFGYIHYGTGTGTPSQADSSLFSFSGAIAPNAVDDVYSQNQATNVMSVRRKIVLDETMANGITITEVGIGKTNSASSLCTHAMLKDMNGNPVSITKTNTDILTIYATVFVHFLPETTTNETFAYCGLMNRFMNKFLTGVANGSTDSFDCGAIPTNLMIGGHWSGPTRYTDSGNPTSLTGALECNPGTWSVPVTVSYDTANKKITFTGLRFPVGSGNVSGIQYVTLCANGGTSSARQIVPVFGVKVGGTYLPPTNIVGESVGTGDGTTVDFRTKFGLAKNATVYVDGVAVNATVDYIPVLTDGSVSQYFQMIEPYPTKAPYYTPSINGGISNGATNDEYTYWYNPYYEYGVAKLLYHVCVYLESSDDKLTWTKVRSIRDESADEFVIPEVSRYHKYWRLKTGGYMYRQTQIKGITPYQIPYDIHLSNAPASGSVITIDYTTDVIPKDSDHVLDLSMTVQLGEYTQ